MFPSKSLILFFILTCLSKATKNASKAPKNVDFQFQLQIPRKYSDADKSLKNKRALELLQDTSLILSDIKTLEVVNFLFKEYPNSIWDIKVIGLDFFPFHKSLVDTQKIAKKIYDIISTLQSFPAIYYFDSVVQI